MANLPAANDLIGNVTEAQFKANLKLLIENVFSKQKGDALDKNVNSLSKNLNALKQYIDSLVVEANEGAVANLLGDLLAELEATGAGENGWTDQLILTQSGQTQRELNAAFVGKTWFAPIYGVKADGITDDAPALNSIIAQMRDGDILEVLPRKHKTSGPIILDKAVLVTSCSTRHQTQAALFECESDGVVFRCPWAKWQSVSLVGEWTDTILDPKNNVFGSIGFKHEYSSFGTSSGVVTEDCFVTYFDTNIAEFQESGQIWAGAYRDYVRVFSRYGRIGYATVNGGTFNNWWGGAIQFCAEWGIYSDASKLAYNNTMLHGTAVEKNGITGDFVFEGALKLGTYVGKNSKLFFLGGYSEDNSLFATDGGRIHCFGSHQHLVNARMFSIDGSVSDEGGWGAKITELDIKDSYATFLSPSLGPVTLVRTGSNKPDVKITTNINTDFNVASRTIPMGALLGSDIQAIKLSINYKFTTGFIGNQNLVLEPILRLTSSTSGRSDSSRSYYNYPLAVLKQSYGVEHSFEFVWSPRVMEKYIDPTTALGSLQLILKFKNGEEIADFSNDNLQCHISNIKIEAYAAKNFSFRSEILKSGTTANRPKNLGAYDVGFVYYDTGESREFLWDGYSWVKQKTPGDDLFGSYSEAQLLDRSHSVNTTYKLSNNFIFNNTNGKMYFRTGTTAGSVWRATDGSGDITPV